MLRTFLLLAAFPSLLAAQAGSPAGPVPVELLQARRAALFDRIGTRGYAANILVDGSVTPCAFISYSPAMNMGNIHENSFRAIWNSADYRKLRTAHRAGTWNNQPCANCRNYVE